MSQYFTYFPTVNYNVFFDGQTSELTDIFRIVKVKKLYKDDVTYYTYYNIQDGERPDVVSAKLYGTPDYFWSFFMVNDNLVNIHTDWPLSNTDLQHLVDKKYPGYVLETDQDISVLFTKNNYIEGLVSGARARITDKDPNTGVIKIDNITGTFVPNEIVRDPLTNDFVTIMDQILFKDAIHHFENADGDYVTIDNVNAIPITNTEFEFNKNDTKSQIKVIRPQYVQVITDQFIQQIKTEEL